MAPCGFRCAVWHNVGSLPSGRPCHHRTPRLPLARKPYGDSVDACHGFGQLGGQSFLLMAFVLERHGCRHRHPRQHDRHQQSRNHSGTDSWHPVSGHRGRPLSRWGQKPPVEFRHVHHSLSPHPHRQPALYRDLRQLSCHHRSGRRTGAAPLLEQGHQWSDSVPLPIQRQQLGTLQSDALQLLADTLLIRRPPAVCGQPEQAAAAFRPDWRQDFLG